MRTGSSLFYRTPDPVVCLIWSRPPGEELAHLTPPELSEPGSEPRLWAEGPDSHPVFLPPPTPRVARLGPLLVSGHTLGWLQASAITGDG